MGDKSTRYYKNRPCKNKGIMSYDSEKAKEWSECSKNDFKALYNLQRDFDKKPWCLEELGSNPCGSGGDDCKDKKSNCNWYEQKYKVCSNYKDWAEKNCPKFCKICGGGGGDDC